MEEILDLFSIHHTIHCIIIDYLSNDLTVIVDCNLSVNLVNRVLKEVKSTFGLYRVILDLCKHGKNETIKHLINIYFNYDKTDVDRWLKTIFKSACLARNYNIMEWMNMNYNIEFKHLDLYELYEFICNNNKSKAHDKIISLLLDIHDRLGHSDYLVHSACTKNSICVLENLYDNEDYRDCIDDEAFVIACDNGHLEVVLWLTERFTFHNNTLEEGFERACKSYRKPIIKWYIRNPDILNKIMSL